MAFYANSLGLSVLIMANKQCIKGTMWFDRMSVLNVRNRLSMNLFGVLAFAIYFVLLWFLVFYILYICINITLYYIERNRDNATKKKATNP